MKRSDKLFFGVVATVLAASMTFIGMGIGKTVYSHTKNTTKVVSSKQGMMTVYIKDEAPRAWPRKDIQASIPAWEKAANRDFRKYWDTPQVRIRLLKRGATVPPSGVVAYIRNNGQVNGALAYHGNDRSRPFIMVYAGTGYYFGYSNSVSFTHELFELLGDSTISVGNQGYPYPLYYVGMSPRKMPYGAVWGQEVCDPVERFSYQVKGEHGKRVAISDFVTPAWYNDHTGGKFDFMDITEAPFTTATGGYSFYWDGTRWIVIFNFRHAGRGANAFWKGEKKTLPVRRR